MRESHREAARALYEERNKGGRAGGEVYVDLHGEFLLPFLYPLIFCMSRVLIDDKQASTPKKQ